MRLVNAHYNKPSFNGSSIEAVIGKEYKITLVAADRNDTVIYFSESAILKIK